MSNHAPPNSKVPAPPLGVESTAPSLEDILSKPHPVRVELDDISNNTREEVAQAMNSEMFVCPIDKFLISYNPAGTNIVAEDIPGCKEYLLDTGVLQQVCGDWRWRDYHNPLLAKGTDEKDVYDDLKHIVNDVFQYAESKQKKTNTFSFQMVPDNSSRSGGPGSHRMINACVVEAPFTSTLQNHNIIVAFEGKLAWDAKGQVEVREQIMADSHSILCDDPRRMLIYGVTLEDNRMSVWYFSRTHSVKAFAFDWVNKDIDTFIQVMLSFAFGAPEDLGIDPTVHKAPRDNMDAKQHYVYEFEIEAKSSDNLLCRCETETATRSKTAKPNIDIAKRKILAGKKVYYRTISSLNDQRPLCISERITRICKVEEVQSFHSNLRVPGTEPVILKDVWADVDLLDEGANQDAIFKAVDMFIAAGLEKYSGPDAMMQFINNEERFKEFNDSMKARLKYLFTEKNYRALFLTKLHARRGRESKPLSQYALRCSSRLFSRGSFRVLPELTIDEQSEANVHPHTVASTRRYPPKVQLRFVYKEVCTEVHALPTFGDVMKVLRQTLDALQIMYCAGWVHRDISIGNIMATPIREGGQIAGWNVKLADLEFAQPMGYPRHRAHSMTGTPYYMPVEIMAGKSLAKQFRIQEADPDLLDLMPAKRSLAGHFGLEADHPSYRQLNAYDVRCLGWARLPDVLPANAAADPESLLPKAAVKHNYQHDLESIWWIVVYFITIRAGHHQSDAGTRFTDRNFTYRDNGHRQITFTGPIGDKLDDIIHPTLRKKITPYLELLREYMYGQYLARTVFGQTMMHHTYAGVHAKFALAFDLLLGKNLENWQQLPVYKRGAVREVKCGSSNVGDKRGRDDAEGDDPTGGVNKRLKHD